MGCSSSTPYGAQQFLTACEKCDEGVISSMLMDPALDINQTDQQGAGALVKVCLSSNCSSRLLAMLLKHEGINVNLCDQSGRGALDYSCRFGRAELVSVLVQDERLEINHKNKGGGTALHVASQQGFPEVVKLLLAHPDVGVNLTTNDGATALFIAAERGRKEVVSLLLSDAKVDVNLAMPWKLQGATVEATPLFAATFQEETEIADLLRAHPGVELPRYSMMGTAKGHPGSKDEHMEMAI